MNKHSFQKITESCLKKDKSTGPVQSENNMKKNTAEDFSAPQFRLKCQKTESNNSSKNKMMIDDLIPF